MSEGNKLPALSFEVKNLNDPTIKRYSVTLRASRLSSICEGRRIDVNHQLVSGMKTKTD